MGLLYTITTRDLGSKWFRQQNKKPNRKQGLRDLGPSKKNQHYVNKLNNFKNFKEKTDLLLSIFH